MPPQDRRVSDLC